MTDDSLKRGLEIKQELAKLKSTCEFYDKKIKQLANEAFKKENKVVNILVKGSEQRREELGWINGVDLDLFVEFLESQKLRNELIIKNLLEEFEKL